MAYKFHSYREESKINWGVNLDEDQKLNFDGIQLGAILRIADASEKMAKNYQQLIDERDRYKQYYEQEQKINHSLRMQIIGIRGYITRLKKRIKK